MRDSLKSDSDGPVVSKPKPLLDLISETWSLYRSNWKMAVGGPALFLYVPMIVVGIPVCLVAFVIGIITLLISKGLYWIAMFPIGLVGVILYALAVNRLRVTWTRIALKMLRGQESSFSEFKGPAPNFFNFFIAMLLIGIATAVGGFCLVIPGIFIAVRTSFAPFLIVDEDLGPIEALLKSNELVSGY